MNAALRGAWAAGLLLLGCGADRAFACTEDPQCGDGGACEASGYCSVEDLNCVSGRRYAESAGDALAGTCVGTGGSSGGTGGSDSAGVPACELAGDPGVCVPAALEGWRGPVLAFTAGMGTSPTPCPVGSTAVLQANADLTASAAQCSCTCAADPAGCGTVQITDCMGGPVSGDIVAGTCEPFAQADPTESYSVTFDAFGDTVCAPDQTPMVAEPSWGTALAACEPDVATNCEGDQLCLPAPSPDAGVCVYQEGDVTCPLSTYTQRFRFFRAVADDRSCSPCTCSTQPGVDPDVPCALMVSEDPGCLMSVLAISNDVCEPFLDLVGGATPYLNLAPLPGGCTPTPGQPTGQAVASDPITLCCAP